MTKNQILIHLSESENTKFGKEEFARQSFPQKVFSAIWAVESEVNNGGFSQYFVNSSKETAAFVVEALRTIGAPDTAAICLSLRVKISDIVNSSEVSQRARVWVESRLGGRPSPRTAPSHRAAPNGVCGAAFVRGRYITEVSRALFIGRQSAVAYTASWALSPHAPGRDSCS